MSPERGRDLNKHYLVAIGRFQKLPLNRSSKTKDILCGPQYSGPINQSSRTLISLQIHQLKETYIIQYICYKLQKGKHKVLSSWVVVVAPLSASSAPVDDKSLVLHVKGKFAAGDEVVCCEYLHTTRLTII
ncbi:hypothetical protein PRUPE_1G469400 [Prunus persica]|uniref:Uncharacterized protein n=1 Tax=Prunus persica TaxID=3760 RepID=A0A251RE71_PRUPE|nr:hypothetical protein PRUPE_1G469400 [Prunus persica]